LRAWQAAETSRARRRCSGATLRLTLDLSCSAQTEIALGKARNNGAVAAIDPRSGAVLRSLRARLSIQIFSRCPKKTVQPDYRQIVANPGHPLLSRPICPVFRPLDVQNDYGIGGFEQGTLSTGQHRMAGGLKMGRFFGCTKHHA
jgi:hypothetical protein